MKEVGKLVLVTDFGQVVVPDSVRDKYLETYFRKRAPKKSRAFALAQLERDVTGMVHYAWLCRDGEVRW